MRCTLEEAERMVAKGQARWRGGAGRGAKTRKTDLQLCAHVDIPPPTGGTRTSRGAYMGAIGRSQKYTIEDKGMVTGFKRIAEQDRCVFQAAALGIDV